MLVVKAELDPAGDGSAAKEIGRLKIISQNPFDRSGSQTMSLRQDDKFETVLERFSKDFGGVHELAYALADGGKRCLEPANLLTGMLTQIENVGAVHEGKN